jgi:hypothetical protein
VFTARYVLPKLCIFCGSENKQRVFHCTALSDYVLSTKCISVFCVDLRTKTDDFTVQL